MSITKMILFPFLVEYRHSLQCYKEIYRDRMLSVCEPIWPPVAELLYNITSYEYYCEPHSDKSIKVKE